MKIGVLGNFGSGNLGNDGSLEAMLRFLRNARPNAQFVCICSRPNEVRERFGLPAVPIRRGSFLTRLPLLHAAFNFLYALIKTRDIDVLIAPGTGLLDDFSDSPWGMPASLVLWCGATRAWRAKIAFVSVGAGPIANPLSCSFIKAAARMVHYRSYRDTASKEFMQSIGLGSQDDPIYPDLAFGLSIPTAPAATPAPERPVTVGVGVMRYYGWRGHKEQGGDIYRGYLQRLARFVVWLLDRKFRVRLLVGDEVDQSAIEDFLDALVLERPDYPRTSVVAEQAGSLDDVMHQVADTDFVVATRFHNIICALKLRKPCISIGYAPKFDVLMAEMGLAEFCQHIERLDIDRLTAQLSDLMANQAAYREALDKVNREYERQLSLQEGTLLKLVLT